MALSEPLCPALSKIITAIFLYKKIVMEESKISLLVDSEILSIVKFNSTQFPEIEFATEISEFAFESGIIMVFCAETKTVKDNTIKKRIGKIFVVSILLDII